MRKIRRIDGFYDRRRSPCPTSTRSSERTLLGTETRIIQFTLPALATEHGPHVYRPTQDLSSPPSTHDELSPAVRRRSLSSRASLVQRRLRKHFPHESNGFLPSTGMASERPEEESKTVLKETKFQMTPQNKPAEHTFRKLITFH